MAISKSISLSFVVLCSWAFVGCSQMGVDQMACVQKLLPCQPYLKGSSSPPSSCCGPLKEIVADESKCLCAVFNNPAILKSLNVTQEDGLNLVKTCGGNADPSICEKASVPPGSPPSAPSSPSNSSTTTTRSPPPKSGATEMSQVQGSLSLAAIILSFVASAL